ncbi:MAG: Hsp70 family protein [Victivallales bacterium]|nr:Hsp70 family protein [Victivallales bacterium]
MRPIGIDLGTTYSAVATISENGQPKVIKNADGESTTPSVVYFPPTGEPIVGSEAKEYQAVGENDIASFFKRDMGDKGFFQIFQGRKYSPTELSSLVLKKLKADAEAELGESIEAAVITVPAYFNNGQRNATIEAARLAGMRVLRIINEPTSAAIAYGLSSKTKAGTTTMVYDLGGGTFDVSIVKASDSEIAVLATDGDHKLGGKDWDDRFAAYLAAQFKEQFGADPFEDQESFNDLMIKCEKAKRELSQRDSTKVSIVHNGEKGTYTLTRAQFAEMTRDLLERTHRIAQSVLNSVEGLTWEKLDGVLLVGGSTRMPMVAQFVEEMTGRPPLRGINVDEAVALGAALQAAADLQSEDDLSLEASSSEEFTLPTIRDVTCHSLGMVAENQDRTKYLNSIIIKKNTPIPAENASEYTIRVSRNREANKLEVYMLQGEVEVPLECTVLGKYVFSGFLPTKTGRAQLRVHYAYNRNGTVDVRAEQLNAEGGLANLTLTIEPVPEDMSWLGRSPLENDPPAPPPVSLVIAVDASGSMSGEPMKEAKKAALSMVEKLDLDRFHVGIMAFSDQMATLTECTSRKKDVIGAINALDVGLGYGNDACPFEKAMKMMDRGEGAKFIVLLTDGCWSYPKKAIAQAAKVKDEGAEIIAIGFGSADHRFLKTVATCDENALMTDLSGLVDSFSKIAQVLSSGDSQQNTSLVMPDDPDEQESGKGKRKGFFSRFF